MKISRKAVKGHSECACGNGQKGTFGGQCIAAQITP